MDEFRKEANEPRPGYAMRLEGVRMKHYDAKGLVSYGHADIVDVASDGIASTRRESIRGFTAGDEGDGYSVTHGSYTDYTSHMVAHRSGAGSVTRNWTSPPTRWSTTARNMIYGSSRSFKGR